MTIANDIISRKMPNFDLYVREGESLDDIDEYGFTPLIECAITRQPKIAEQLINRGVDINKSDVTGRTPLHWAVDNDDEKMVRLLLERGADPNMHTRSGMSPLVYPILREQNHLKHLLYQHHAKLEPAQDFVLGKLIGHRYELSGDVDIVNAKGEFIELDYEGFILEFTVAVILDSLKRFSSSFSTRQFRQYFDYLHHIMDAFEVASNLLKFQHHPRLTEENLQHIAQLIKADLLILPAASRGHAMGFVKYKQWWAKIDRGENSLKEGSVNIYKITHPEAFNLSFIKAFLYQKQSRRFFHEMINQKLGLLPISKFPMSSQISGNCSWANIQAAVAVGYVLTSMAVDPTRNYDAHAKELYTSWLSWDKDRALDQCIQRFYHANQIRKASLASMLGAVLFQSLDHSKDHDVERAEKILTVLSLPEYHYILQSYLDVFCAKRLTPKGNNLLKLLDDCGYNPNIGVTPIATGLHSREER